ncbi:hypothetical protein BDV93DRAFT_569173 [Ceratobasidium sp. AG-I]|nr:hypothetical protein BDV93DRAFT_569173 [Ceratobasidium sp. AG-I]
MSESRNSTLFLPNQFSPPCLIVLACCPSQPGVNSEGFNNRVVEHVVCKYEKRAVTNISKDWRVTSLESMVQMGVGAVGTAMTIQDPRATGSRESCLRRSWALDFVSLGLHLMTGVERDPRAARILGLLFQKPAAEIEGALTVFEEAMNMPVPEQSLMRVLELLESLAFQWIDATSVEPIELCLFADLNSDSCLRPDAPEGLVSDISTRPPAPIPPFAMLSPAPFSSLLRPGAHDNIVLSRLQDGFSPVRSSSPRGSHGSIMKSCSTPTLDSGMDSGSDLGLPPVFNDVSQLTRTPKAYHYVNNVTIGTRLAWNPKFSLGADSLRSCTLQRRV